MRIESSNILLTSGSLQALDLVNTLLLQKGDTVLVEEATYGGAISRLESLGVNMKESNLITKEYVLII